MTYPDAGEEARNRAAKIEAERRSEQIAIQHAAEERERLIRAQHDQASRSAAEYEQAEAWGYGGPDSYYAPRR